MEKRRRFFNITGACDPRFHYMVNLQSRLEKIRKLVDQGAYFTINRARQYGKTTILNALKSYLQQEYFVIIVDFQMISYGSFKSEEAFVKALSRELLTAIQSQKKEEIPDSIQDSLKKFAADETSDGDLGSLFYCLSSWCGMMEKSVVWMIDEVDSAANNQVFLDFLAQLRGYYMHREERPAFQSVILAGVYDVKNIRQKLSPGEEMRKTNSPWNIAADFRVDMEFTRWDIEGMLQEYGKDHGWSDSCEKIACLIYEYTSGYPFLVSWLCKYIDEKKEHDREEREESKAWTRKDVLQAVKAMLSEGNTLFESLIHKLQDYPELDEMLRELLLQGKEIPYVIGVSSIDMALMFGFVKKETQMVVVANRIFETLLYNLFLASPDTRQEQIYNVALKDKNQFVKNGCLDMKRVMEKFVCHFDSLYGDQNQDFLEEDGRRYFLLYLRPIINGIGNFYVESRTRNMERTDVIVDYGGEQFVIEMKIWRGNAYHTRGEAQLTSYLDYYKLQKGYMLSFNFNKKKKIGVREIRIGDKIIVEAVV